MPPAPTSADGTLTRQASGSDGRQPASVIPSAVAALSSASPPCDDDDEVWITHSIRGREV